MPVMAHLAIDGHCEMVFKNVRVPAGPPAGRGRRLCAGAGAAGAWAGAPLHAHHRPVRAGAGTDVRARAGAHDAFGRHLSDFANVQDWIGHSRVEIDQAAPAGAARGLADGPAGNAAARVDVSAIKLVAAQLQTRVLDRAMQVFGAIGLTPDTPLAALWSWGRALRFLDGPDEVHLRTVARHELARTKTHLGANVLHLNRWMPPEAVSDLG
jgi:acyl-CoA dehydrogenase